MNTDDKYRSFLLGTADEETRAEVEEGILDGRVGLDHLHQIEEDLIDDHLFGRLSAEEEHIFRSEFLTIPERTRKLEFATALQRYSAHQLPLDVRRGVLAKMRELASVPTFLPLVGALSCSLLVTLWLGARNIILNHELTQAAHSNNKHDQLLESMVQEQKRRASQFEASKDSSGLKPAVIPNSEEAVVQPIFRLSPGVSRGLAAVPVLYLNRQTRTVSIMIELPFRPLNTMREELLSSEDKTIWRQEFASTDGVIDHGTATIVFPAGLLRPGEYRLRAEADPKDEHPGGTAMYLFRVQTR